MSHQLQRRGQPVRRTKTVGSPVREVHPCSEWKISVMRRAGAAGLGHGGECLTGDARRRRWGRPGPDFRGAAGRSARRSCWGTWRPGARGCGWRLASPWACWALARPSRASGRGCRRATGWRPGVVLRRPQRCPSADTASWRPRSGRWAGSCCPDGAAMKPMKPVAASFVLAAAQLGEGGFVVADSAAGSAAVTGGGAGSRGLVPPAGCGWPRCGLLRRRGSSLAQAVVEIHVKNPSAALMALARSLLRTSFSPRRRAISVFSMLDLVGQLELGAAPASSLSDAAVELRCASG